MARTQEHRAAAVSSPLGADALLFKSMNATEELGRLFQIDLVLLSEDTDISFADIVGQNVSIRIEQPDGERRFFNGFVSRFAHISSDGTPAEYRATLVPWLWFLTRTADCRIFQKKTVPDIIKEIFGDAGFSDFEDALTESYREWDYCVQYRETDFNFISRLMEQEGIYYYFEHDDGKHTMVLADSDTAHSPYAGYEALPYRPPGTTTTIEHVTRWVAQHAVQPDTFVHTDYDFETPKKDLLAKSMIPPDHQATGYEVFDYPGEYVENSDGESYAKIRAEELQVPYRLFSGGSDARGIAVGSRLELTEHPREDQCGEYLVTRTSIHAESDEYGSGGGGGGSGGGRGGFHYSCDFRAVPSNQRYRAERVTPKPIIQGPQTAVVTGPSGEEIWTDKHSRVKVQFHWDRYGENDENSSCWVRVSQNWAGKEWGVIQIPRIGQEVIVEFLEGDPDQPIITGRVYNGDNMPPYGLPDNATQSGVKSRSSKGGSADNFNEIRMEDKKGEEQLYIHAEKNEDIVVENDKTESVGHDETITIGNDRTETVGHDETLTVENDRTRNVTNNETITIGNDRVEAVKNNEDYRVTGERKETVEGNRHLVVKSESFEKIESTKHTAITGDHNQKTGGKTSLQTAEIHEKVDSNVAIDAGQEIHLKAGMTLVVEAGMEITIKAGANFIKMDPSGVTIQGMMVKLNSGGAAGNGSGASPTDPTDASEAV